MPEHPPSPPTGPGRDYMIEVLDSDKTDNEKVKILKEWLKD